VPIKGQKEEWSVARNDAIKNKSWYYNKVRNQQPSMVNCSTPLTGALDKKFGELGQEVRFR
jgi:hypothetical protein